MTVEAVKAKLAEIRENNRLRGNMFTNWVDPEKERLIAALEAVLALPLDDEVDNIDERLEGLRMGHNIALRDVHAAVRKALGVGE